MSTMCCASCRHWRGNTLKELTCRRRSNACMHAGLRVVGDGSEVDGRQPAQHRLHALREWRGSVLESLGNVDATPRPQQRCDGTESRGWIRHQSKRSAEVGISELLCCRSAASRQMSDLSNRQKQAS
eukprot:6207160-Pleurochrysis_carterae.AAC.1